jgi:lysophospholipase L1-like esterase
MKFILGLVLVAAIAPISNIKKQGPVPVTDGKIYLALGDSYTIGESVPAKKSFPYQLADQLIAGGIKVAQPRIIAQTGWTTADLIQAIKLEKLNTKYDFITLLIGVNNQYMNESIDTYRKEFKQLLSTAISCSKGGKATVFVISFPDWTVTPFGKRGSSREAAASVDKFNAVNKLETLNAGVNYIDISIVSRLADKDESLIAADGLHPSAKLYSQWVRQLYPAVKARLKN